MSFYVWRTARSGKYHIAAGSALTAPARDFPLEDAGLCSRLDVGTRFPDCLEWDPVAMSLPGYASAPGMARTAVCGDCLRIWEREAIVTKVAGNV